MGGQAQSEDPILLWINYLVAIEFLIPQYIVSSLGKPRLTQTRVSKYENKVLHTYHILSILKSAQLV